MQFTAQSLNSGFFAMAEQLDLCDIEKVATRMGVTNAKTGEPVEVNNQFSIIGSSNVSPLAMAGAYATVANNGIYCQPKAIDRVVDSDGAEMAPPARACTQVIDPKVAATAAYALEGVMQQRRHGIAGQPLRRHSAHRQDRHARGVPHLDDRVEHEGDDRGVGRQLRRFERRLRALRHPALHHSPDRRRRLRTPRTAETRSPSRTRT